MVVPVGQHDALRDRAVFHRNVVDRGAVGVAVDEYAAAVTLHGVDHQDALVGAVARQRRAARISGRLQIALAVLVIRFGHLKYPYESSTSSMHDDQTAKK